MYTELVLQTWSAPYIPNADEINELKSGIIEGDTEFYWKFIGDGPSIISDDSQSTLFYLLLCGTPACMVWATGALAYKMAELLDGQRTQISDDIVEFCLLTNRSLTDIPCNGSENVGRSQGNSIGSDIQYSERADFVERFRYVTVKQRQLFSDLLGRMSGYADNDDHKAIILNAYNDFWKEFGQPLRGRS